MNKFKKAFGKKVISRENLPTRSPVVATVVYFIALDYWNAPQWLWGAVGLLMLIIWIFFIIEFARQEEVDVLDDKE